jgi:hypothetical protein
MKEEPKWLEKWGKSIFYILSIFLILTFVMIYLSNSSSWFCEYRTICHLSYNGNCWDLQNPEFDCDIIYSRLGKYWNKTSPYVLGSIANIETTACSDEVLGILEKQFNLTLRGKKCEYDCCVTDGNCYNGVGINSQALCISELK